MLFIQASPVEEKEAAALEAPLGAAAPAEAAGPVVEAAARTQDSRFACPVCGLAFTTKHSLQQHLLRKHAAAEPIICSYGQAMPDDCDAHLKRPIHRKRMVRYVMYTFLSRKIVLFINF
jgi:hypothetical protein